MEQLNFFNESNTKSEPKKFNLHFINDNTQLHKDFVKDSVFKMFLEHENNYIIFHKDVYYGPFKDNCIKSEVNNEIDENNSIRKGVA